MTEADNFFVTNRGQRVTKLYDDVNRIYGNVEITPGSNKRLSATVFRRMIEIKSRGHRSKVGRDVAMCLQHGEGTALKFYILPDASEGIRSSSCRQEKIKLIDQTELFQVAVLAK